MTASPPERPLRRGPPARRTAATCRSALVRIRASAGGLRVNPKRVYRVTAGHGLLLPKAPRRPQSSRAHTGTVSVLASDTRWCSDGFEIKCDSGQTVTATFAKDCCDREIMAFRAWEGKGLAGEPVREMLIEAVEKRFGAVEAIPAGHLVQFLSDNGSAYIAHETRRIAAAALASCVGIASAMRMILRSVMLVYSEGSYGASIFDRSVVRCRARARKTAIGQGVTAAGRTMGARCFRSGSWRRSARR